jgi:hypothetical protein
LYEEALRASNDIENAEYKSKVVNLQAAIKYAQDDIKSCISYLQKYSSDDPALELNKACILFKVRFLIHSS